MTNLTHEQKWPDYHRILDAVTSEPRGKFSDEEADALALILTAKPLDLFTAAEIDILEKHLPSEFKAYNEFHCE